MPLKDYDIFLRLRCESKPQTWIVDVMYEQLNAKLNEDILSWDVKEVEQTNTKPTPNKVKKDENND